ncbi:unnamed protein product [Musa hybrid cultivar]
MEEEEGVLPHLPVQTWTTVSFMEEEDGAFHHLPLRTWTRNDHEAETSAKKPMDTLRGKAIMDSRDDYYDSTTISGDNFDDFCEWQDEVRLGRRDWVLENELYSTGAEPQRTDDELRENLEAVEETLSCLADKDLKYLTIQIRKIPKQALFDALRECADVRRYQLLQLAEQLRGRIADRFEAAEHLIQVRIDLDARARRLEWEKSEVQISLEKELETRSIDYSMKLKMLLVDEQELKKQVRELEEQSASLQREISWLRGGGKQNQVTTANSEMEITNLKAAVEELRTENGKLRKDLSEMQEKLDASEEDRRRIARCFCEKEKENNELQKLVASLKQECDEQERTISGLRLGYNDEVENRPTDENDQLSRLQMEQLRSTGIEQKLRKELETCKHEQEKLRHENIGLLSRLQDAGNGGDVSWIKLDQELRARVDCLQTEGLSLLGDLLGLLDSQRVEQKQEEPRDDTSGHLPVDYTIRNQSLNRRHENFRISLQTVAKILDEKSLPAEGSSMSKQSEAELEIKQLETESQEYTEELTAARSMLSEVTEQRNQMWEEVKKSKEDIMLIDDEVATLKKKTKELKEDILTEEGQIADLRDEIADLEDSLEKPFDLICSSTSVEESQQK